jgi:hypothetical protein
MKRLLRIVGLVEKLATFSNPVRKCLEACVLFALAICPADGSIITDLLHDIRFGANVI